MCSTPAPPLTAWVAASTWSGVGEVKTGPGAAASSIPAPTKPPCSGSWPLPPPETSATLPGDRRVGAGDEGGIELDREQIRMRLRHALQGLRCHGGRIVDDLLHDSPLDADGERARDVGATSAPVVTRPLPILHPTGPLGHAGGRPTRGFVAATTSTSGLAAGALPQPDRQAGDASLELLELGDVDRDRRVAEVGDQLGGPRRRRRPSAAGRRRDRPRANRIPPAPAGSAARTRGRPPAAGTR